MEFMRKEGRAEWVGKEGAGECWVWWRTPEEWAGGMYEWVSSCCVEMRFGDAMLMLGRLMRRHRRIRC